MSKLKSGVAVILAVVIFILAVQLIAPGIIGGIVGNVIAPKYKSCTDTDDINLYEKGAVTYTSRDRVKVYNDFCYSDDELKEYFCGERKYKVQIRNARCVNGCEDGACKRIEVKECDAISETVKVKIGQLEDEEMRVVLLEGDNVGIGDYVVVGNINTGGVVLMLEALSNGPGFENDKIMFVDAIDSVRYVVDVSEEGKGSMNVLNQEISVKYNPESVFLRWSNVDVAEEYFNC